MIIGIHRQPNMLEDEAGYKLVAGKTLEEVYKAIIQQLRLDEGQNGDLTTITFSNGIQVVVRREETWDDSFDELGANSDNDEEGSVDSVGFDEFSSFDEELGDGRDLVDTFIETPEIRFREISSTNLSKEDLISVFTRTVYRYKE